MKKTIIYILIFMILINSILPAKIYAKSEYDIVFGDEKIQNLNDQPIDKSELEKMEGFGIETSLEEGKYFKVAEVKKTGRYSTDMKYESVFYVKDGKVIYPDRLAFTSDTVILEEGTKVYFKEYFERETTFKYNREANGEDIAKNNKGIEAHVIDSSNKSTFNKETGLYYVGESVLCYDENNNLKALSPIVIDGKKYFYLEKGKEYLFYKQAEKVTDQGATSYVFEKYEADIPKGDEAALIQKILTQSALYIGTNIYGLVCIIIGETFSIEKIIFNDFSNTKLGFFEGSEINNFLEEMGIKIFLNDFFNSFRGIAILVYLIILVYMGIRIMLGATAEKGAKYKQLMMYWLEGIIILFLFPYVMKYAIQINDMFVSFIYENKNVLLTDNKLPEVDAMMDMDLEGVGADLNQIINAIGVKTDFMSLMYVKGMTTGWFTYAICWYVMFFQMIGFLIAYFKRVLIIMFLIAIFPLVMISYAIDKIGDTKSQAFGNWVKEFLINVFIQSFHAISYVLIMSLIYSLMDNPEDNWIIILVAISFISKGDDILRAIFALNSGVDTVKGIGQTLAQAAAIKSVAKGLKDTKDAIIGPKSMVRKTNK